MMKKVIAVIGPTGVGKTALGVNLAKWLETEIISGDSIQVYRGLDIGSAKVTEEEMQGIPHHLIDILPLESNYSVYDFQKQGREVMAKLHDESKIPIVVGGTGLYIKSLLYDYTFETSNDENEVDYSGYTNEELYARLLEVDEESAKLIHPNNRKRIIRAIKIFDTHGKRKSDIEKEQKHEMLYDAFIIGLTCDREIVYDRINRRVDIMVNNGLLDEIAKLSKLPNVFDYQGMQGIGYKEFRNYCSNEATLEETLEEIKKHSRQFAKRQYTWFNNQMDVHWYDIMQDNYLAQIKSDLEVWMKEE